jgi:hypothetical protein
VKSLGSIKLDPAIRIKTDRLGRAILHATCTVKPTDGERRVRVMVAAMPGQQGSGRQFFGTALLSEVMIPEEWEPQRAVEVIEGICDLFAAANGLLWVFDNADRVQVMRQGRWMRKAGEKVMQDLRTAIRATEMNVPKKHVFDLNARAQASAKRKDSPR